MVQTLTISEAKRSPNIQGPAKSQQGWALKEQNTKPRNRLWERQEKERKERTR